MFKAITIWLILPTHISDLCAEYNHSLWKNGHIWLELGWPYPHISLVQCVLTDDEIVRVSDDLSTKEISPINCKDINLHRFVSTGSWSKVTYFNIADASINDLHSACMDIIEFALNRKSVPSHYIYPDHISEGQLQYVTNYWEQYAYKNYSPHITIGKWHLGDNAMLPDFTCTQIWVFHMWPSGSCQTLLHTIDIW